MLHLSQRKCHKVQFSSQLKKITGVKTFQQLKEQTLNTQ